MNTIVTRRSESSESFDPIRRWLTGEDQARLRATISRAVAQARRLRHPIVASYTLTIPHIDPIAIFTAPVGVRLGDAFFWEQPSAGKSIVGLGAASAISGQGSGSLRDAAAHWRQMLRDAVAISAPDAAPAVGQPRCYGGFAFDPLRRGADLWDGFPDALLVLPRVMFSADGETTTLTLNTLVHSETLADASADRLALDAHVARLAVERAVAEALPVTDAPAAGSVALAELRPAAEWMRLVGETAAAVRRGVYHKVVLARGAQAQASAELPVGDALQRLRHDAPTATIFAVRRQGRTFLGATPERLAAVSDGRLRTVALAGTAPRGATPDEDARLGAELTQSAKNREEHAIVVGAIRDAIAPLCAVGAAPDAPQLLRLATVQHLMTPITGALAPDVSLLDVVAALHPTPAVGGYPTRAALDAIREHEGLDRGWYAGPVGWLDAQGGGEFVVALRSALLDGAQATLFAGCGVVADSDPQAEYEESQIKMRVMLHGLGIDAGTHDDVG